MLILCRAVEIKTPVTGVRQVNATFHELEPPREDFELKGLDWTPKLGETYDWEPSIDSAEIPALQSAIRE